jgi:hypothetical protein
MNGVVGPDVIVEVRCLVVVVEGEEGAAYAIWPIDVYR